VELPVDPTEEELARDWTLSAADLQEVLGGCLASESASSESADPDTGTIESKVVTTVTTPQNNTPCVFSDVNGGGTATCFTGTGSASVFGTVRSVRIGNAKIRFRARLLFPIGSPNPVEPPLAFEGGGRFFGENPSWDMINLPPNNIGRIEILWQGANAPLAGAMVVALTNRPDQAPRCLTAPSANGVSVGISPCIGHPTQRWEYFSPLCPETACFGPQLRLASAPGRCLNAEVLMGFGAPITMADCAVDGRQAWSKTFEANGNAPAGHYFNVFEVLTGKKWYLDVKDGDLSSPLNPVWQWGLNFTWAQFWMDYSSYWSGFQSPSH
jgi:hypothetical protein